MNSALRWLGAIAVLSAAAFFMSDYHNDVYRKLMLWVTLALGYNFLFGICGQVSFSHFAFYGIGAYSVVILLFHAHLPLPVAVVCGVADHKNSLAMKRCDERINSFGGNVVLLHQLPECGLERAGGFLQRVDQRG